MLTCRTIRGTGAKVSPNRTPSQLTMELLHTIYLEALAFESDSPAGRFRSAVRQQIELRGSKHFNKGFAIG
jgi:hypothetical protein